MVQTMSEREYFNQQDKNYFTQKKLDDIENARQSWENFNKYRRLNKSLYLYSKYYDGKLIFNESMLTENLDYLDFS